VSEKSEESPYRFDVREAESWFGGHRDRGLHVVLVEPEIPGNTGNIGRLCAGTNLWLHLVRPLGFSLDNRYLKRAGLDYWPHVRLCVHESFEEVAAIFPRERLHFFTTKADRIYSEVTFEPGSVLIFGRETVGLSEEIRTEYEDRLATIPISSQVRSLNLSNACAVVVYEAMRQLDWSPLHLDDS
jgi:tRNA (cytidine/uridine-2'-O-)-methyltransferase